MSVQDGAEVPIAESTTMGRARVLTAHGRVDHLAPTKSERSSMHPERQMLGEASLSEAEAECLTMSEAAVSAPPHTYKFAACDWLRM